MMIASKCVLGSVEAFCAAACQEAMLLFLALML
jgi:hypothetical protein